MTYLSLFFRTGQPQINSICANCRTSQFRAQLFRARPYSAAAVTDAATQAEAHHLKPTESDPHPPITVSPKDEYRIKGGIILTRAPLITRALTPFENAFFFYQKRLEERLKQYEGTDKNAKQSEKLSQAGGAGEIAGLKRQLAKKDQDIETLKKQAEGLHREYNELAEKVGNSDALPKKDK